MSDTENTVSYEKYTELEIALSEMRRERDESRAEARQWKSDFRQYQQLSRNKLKEAHNDAIKAAADLIRWKYNDATIDENGNDKLTWACQEVLTLVKE